VTPEQATEALHKAIADHAIAHELARDDEILSEWAIVSNWQRLEVGDGESRYTTCFRSETTPMHVAAGLFEVGARVIWEDDDDV
jgi:hypothetical protein